MASLLWDGRTAELRWTPEVDPVGERRDPERQSLTYELRLQQLGTGGSYRVSHELLGDYHVNTGREETPMKFLERYPGHAVTFDVGKRKFVAHEGTLA